jgi:hypothetical protein
MKLTTHLHLLPRSKNEWSYTSTPPIRLHGVVLRYSTGTTLPFTFIRDMEDRNEIRKPRSAGEKWELYWIGAVQVLPFVS